MTSLLHAVCVCACVRACVCVCVCVCVFGWMCFCFLDLTQLKECKWSFFFSLFFETLMNELSPSFLFYSPSWLHLGVFFPPCWITVGFSFPPRLPPLSVDISRNSGRKTMNCHTHGYSLRAVTVTKPWTLSTVAFIAAASTSCCCLE